MTWRFNQHPPEGDEVKPDSEDEEAAESIAPPMDPAAQLQADINAAKAEVAEWQDRFLRKAAELENFRKRAEKEKADLMVLARSSILLEFLPIADTCERALKMLQENRAEPGNLQQYHEGVELIYRQLLDALNRAGVTAIKSEGEVFNPHLHEALSRESTPDFEEGTIIRELRRGYLFKDKLLRPAQVTVAVRPQEEGQTPQ